MKQTIVRLILFVLFYLLFAFALNYEVNKALLVAFICTYIIEGAIIEKLRQ